MTGPQPETQEPFISPEWSPFRFDPVPLLLDAVNPAIRYFTRRDLLDGVDVDADADDTACEPVPERVLETVWALPAVETLIRNQQPDGSWCYRGKRTASYPPHHHELVETWKRFRLLVERYELTRAHPVGARAAEYLFSCQTAAGDIRGMIGNQYATYYTGAMLALLIRAGYAADPRVERGMQWLLRMRQDDGGWTIPILTHRFEGRVKHRLTSEYADPVEPDRTRPFSHNWTDMVLRAFAEHPEYRSSPAARRAAQLLMSRFFERDVYPSYQAASYWVRFQFWWANLITALDSLSKLGFRADDPSPALRRAMAWFIGHQEPDGGWKLTYVDGKTVTDTPTNRERRLWLTLRICRVFKRLIRGDGGVEPATHSRTASK